MEAIQGLPKLFAVSPTGSRTSICVPVDVARIAFATPSKKMFGCLPAAVKITGFVLGIERSTSA